MTTTTYKCSVCSVTTNTKHRLTLFIDTSIAKHARAQAVIEDITLTNLVEKALIKYLPEETVIKKSEITKSLGN